MNREVNYKSNEFFRFLNAVNTFLANHNIHTIEDTSGKIFKSKYDTDSNDNYLTIWYLTDKDFPELMQPGLVEAMLNCLKDYIDNKSISVGLYNIKGKSMATIKVRLAELPDNHITLEELLLYKKGDATATAKWLDLESRMFKRENDTRSSSERADDFIWSLIYESKLVEARLVGISGLKLNHVPNSITIEPDYTPDFTGSVNGVNELLIEGKSTKAAINYVDTDNGHAEFAEYFSNRVKSGSLGSLHAANYILLVLKATGDVIGINANNFADNWYAGRIEL